MSRETHVRFCEHLEGRFLRVTRRNVYVRSRLAGERVLQALRGWTAVATMQGRKFLGYCLYVTAAGEVKRASGRRSGDAQAA